MKYKIRISGERPIDVVLYADAFVQNEQGSMVFFTGPRISAMFPIGHLDFVVEDNT